MTENILSSVLDLVEEFGLIGLLSLVVFVVAGIAKWAFQRFFKCHSRAMSTAFMAICITAAIWADKRNAPGNPSSPSAAITQDDIARGFAISGITTNSQFSILNSQFSTHCSIVTNRKWFLRGAYGDWFALPANGWNFPFRGGWMDEPAICAWGEVRPSIGETNALPPLVPFQVSLAPESAHIEPNSQFSILNSQFWHAVTPSNSLILTWENALVERCPTNLASFQAEFFADGRFEYRRQDGGSQTVVVESYTPVFPFDYDDDGLENSVDPEPYAAGPDAHGTNAEWYNTGYSNVLDAVEGDEPNEPEVAWKDGVNTNAYYFIDVVASRGPAAICFAGNATNRLGNPAIVALTAATNHVPLLMGVDYAVTATADFEIIPPEGGFVEIFTNNEGKVHVKWPVNFYAMPYDGNAYYVYVSPADPGGEFVWDGAPPMRGGMRSLSCLSAAFGPYVSFDCGDNCGCGGCYATGTYRYEGMVFSMPLIPCGCSSDDPPGCGIEPTEGPVSNAPPSVTASKRAVIFEDRYENSPGVWVDKRSTTVTITVSADGGVNGGTLTVTTANMDKLNKTSGQSLPFSSVSVPAGYTMSWTGEYEAEEASDSIDDIEITAIFMPNGNPTVSMTDASSLTSVKVELKATKVAPANCCTNRHMYGVNEFVECVHEPTAIPLTWKTTVDDFQFNVDDSAFWCPFNGVEDDIKAMCRDADLTIPVVVKEPASISCNAQWDGNIGQQGIAGDMVMRMTLYVEPRDVSFEDLQMQEIPDDKDRFHEGYFDDKSKGGEWSHNINAGAGWWAPVKTNGYWTVDNVGVISYSQPWIYGRKVWNIPVGWGTQIRELIGRMEPNPTMQEFVIDENGTVTIRKFNHELRRSISCDVWFDGVKVH